MGAPRKLKRLIATASLALALAAPTAAVADILGGTIAITSGGTFIPDIFAVIPTPTLTVGTGAVDANDFLFGFNEKTVTLGGALTLDAGSIAAGTLVQSHYIFFDPKDHQTVETGSYQAGTTPITFAFPILGVISTKSGLDATNALFGVSGVTYATSTLIGLESGDVYSFAGNTLSLDWSATDPGDHIRVITAAVPEPGTYAMILAGLGLMGFMARRRLQGRSG
ncbi:MAG: PEP-CTERM sorting domain-containing protein [Burkholderiales bacterium]|nr:PEP-CTERM sorting domain-containing protein [Burkholderiales bacterium]